MISIKLFNISVIVWIILAVVLFPILLRIKAPYGRHENSRWGPSIDNRLGWFIMELPSLALITFLFLSGNNTDQNAIWVFFILWFAHYFNRIFIFPFRTRTKGKKMPLLVVGFAMVFNLANGFFNGYWLGYIAGDNYAGWLKDPVFIAGLVLFIAGFTINQVADNHLIHLRKGNKTGYSVPYHRLFRYISCPNFAGEIIEWTGYAVLTWSLPGLSFAVWTIVNLVPRALHHHMWYREKFPEYPEKRKALIPGLL